MNSIMNFYFKCNPWLANPTPTPPPNTFSLSLPQAPISHSCVMMGVVRTKGMWFGGQRGVEGAGGESGS